MRVVSNKIVMLLVVKVKWVRGPCNINVLWVQQYVQFIHIYILNKNDINYKYYWQAPQYN